MKPSTSLSLRQRQRLSLVPGLRTGLMILRLPTLDLIDTIQAEAADNPYLLHDDLRPRSAALAGSAYDAALETAVAVRSLVADLHSQIGAMTLPVQVRAVAEYLAGDLREDGYLDTPLPDLAATLGLPLPLLQAGLQALQSCDPAGIGARNLSECLQLQLIDRGQDPELAGRIIGHLDLFAVENWRALRQELAMERPELERIAALIRDLTPHPVSAPATPDAILTPDLVLDKDGTGALRVRLGLALANHVRLNTTLLRASTHGADFAADRLARAEAMIEALRFRGETLLRIGRLIAERQHRFFAHGPDHLAPLSRAMLAAELGMHASTVGRAVASKSLEVRGQLYPLSLFFSTPLPADGDGSVAAFVVQRRIARMIEQEPPSAPLSDDAICHALRATGVDIARRTVAKYRGCMRIPSSFARRRRKAAQRLRPALPASGGFPHD